MIERELSTLTKPDNIFGQFNLLQLNGRFLNDEQTRIHIKDVEIFS